MDPFWHWQEQYFGDGPPSLQEAGGHRRSAQTTSAGTSHHLEQLPLTRTWQVGVTLITLAHGTPWSAHEFIYPNASRDLIVRITASTESQVIILGHIHTPMQITYQDRMIINPGSVCGTRSRGSHTVGVLETDNLAYAVYDIINCAEVDIPHRSIK